MINRQYINQTDKEINFKKTANEIILKRTVDTRRTDKFGRPILRERSVSPLKPEYQETDKQIKTSYLIQMDI